MSSKNQKAELTKCLCGCEQLVRGSYKQGHDAKHVSNLLQGIVEGKLYLAQAQDTLPSWKLQAKLAAAVTRRTGLTGPTRCDDIESATEVKIGRWWYPVTRINRSSLDYTDRKGGVHTVPTSGATYR